ncbi:MAG: DUF3618 domain-containing protein [Terrimesophilobacter sp.]
MRMATERSEAARTELAETLDAIEDKLNVPKQLGILGTRARDSWEKKPVSWIIGVTAVVVVVGGIIAWAVLGDD